MEINIKKYHFFLVFNTIIFLDLFIQVLPPVIFFLGLIILHIFFLGSIENGLFLTSFASILLGAFFIQVAGMYGVGGYAIPLGLILLLKPLFKLKLWVILGYLPLFLILILFALSAYLNTGGDTYAAKVKQTFIYATITYLSFTILWANYRKIKFSSLGLIFIAWSLFILRLSIDINNLPGPSGLLQFGFMRMQMKAIDINATVETYISYQLPGLIALIGVAFFFTRNKAISNFEKGIVWSFGSIVVLYAGARQHILGLIILFSIFVFSLKISNYKKIILSSLFIFGIVFFLSTVNSIYLNNLILSSNANEFMDASGRLGPVDRAFELFFENPIWGVGFGHYNLHGWYGYPHNLFAELLSELGIIGFLMVFIIISIFHNKYSLNYIFKKEYNPYLILIPFFMRSMASLSLKFNVIIFSIIFSYSIFNFVLKREGRYKIKK